MIVWRSVNLSLLEDCAIRCSKNTTARILEGINDEAEKNVPHYLASGRPHCCTNRFMM